MIDWLSLGAFVLLAVLVALIFDFYNGLHDSANSIATVVATRALPVWAALLVAATANFAGAFWGLEVANTVAKTIPEDIVTVHMVLAGLVGAIFWSVLTIWWGIPVSSSHSLIGGLVGAGFAAAGLDGVDLSSFQHAPVAFQTILLGAAMGAASGMGVAAVSGSRVRAGLLIGAAVGSAALLVWRVYHGTIAVKGLFATVLFIAYSPFVGFCLAFLSGSIIIWLVHRLRPGPVRHVFRFLQIGSSALYSVGHGRNDAQKTMGVIAAILVAAGATSSFHVPTEVIIACGAAIGLGTLIGGWKIVRTMGTRLTHLDTTQGFVAETSSASVLFFMADHGVPVSTTHSITGSILGVGSLQRISAVSWGVARRIVMAWIVTIPLAATVAAFTYYALGLFL